MWQAITGAAYRGSRTPVVTDLSFAAAEHDGDDRWLRLSFTACRGCRGLVAAFGGTPLPSYCGDEEYACAPEREHDDHHPNRKSRARPALSSLDRRDAQPSDLQAVRFRNAL